MAGKRIYDTDPTKSLAPLSGAQSANNDKLVIFDVDANETKRIDRSQLAAGLVGDLPYTPSGGISATTIPTAIAELDSEAAKSAALAASSGSSLVGHIGIGTGATARTVQSKLRDYISVKDFGAVGDGVTDDTAAIQAAITYLGSITPWSISPNRGRLRPALYFPAGVYKVSSSLTISFDSLNIAGDGLQSTVIAWYGGNTPVFDIGTFSATPADIFSGPQSHFFSGLRIQHSSPGTIASRTGQGIRSSGGGGLNLSQVAILGFAYGVNVPYGGDFNVYRDTTVEYCDVGVYQGPGGQQFYTNNLNCFACREGLVIDRAGQGQHDLFIGNNCGLAAVVIEAPSNTTTRQLSSFSMSGTSYQSQIVFNSPWLEGNAGGMGDDYIPTHFFEDRNSGGDAYRNITINDPIVVASSSTKTTTSFFASTGALQAQLVRINNIVFFGGMTRFLTNTNGTIIRNIRVATGYSTPAYSDNTGYQVIQGSLRSEVYRSGITGMQQQYINGDGTLGVRVTYGNDTVTWGFSNAGSWIDRFGFNVQNRRLFLDDPAANGFSISRGAMPTTGTYQTGSFVFNTSPSVVGGKTLLGWQRLTTGSGHVLNVDWSPCYVTNT